MKYRARIKHLNCVCIYLMRFTLPTQIISLLYTFWGITRDKVLSPIGFTTLYKRKKETSKEEKKWNYMKFLLNVLKRVHCIESGSSPGILILEFGAATDTDGRKNSSSGSIPIQALWMSQFLCMYKDKILTEFENVSIFCYDSCFVLLS